MSILNKGAFLKNCDPAIEEPTLENQAWHLLTAEDVLKNLEDYEEV